MLKFNLLYLSYARNLCFISYSQWYVTKKPLATAVALFVCCLQICFSTGFTLAQPGDISDAYIVRRYGHAIFSTGVSSFASHQLNFYTVILLLYIQRIRCRETTK